jgi:hypothetical protein
VSTLAEFSIIFFPSFSEKGTTLVGLDSKSMLPVQLVLVKLTVTDKLASFPLLRSGITNYGMQGVYS